MKRPAVLFCLLICFTSYGQLSVDSIKLDEDVKTFLRWFGKEKNLDWYNYEILNKEDNSLTLKNAYWLIEDFNNDGDSDMIFDGFIGSRYCLFAALSENTNYNYFNLIQQQYSHLSVENFKKWPVTIQILQKGSYPLLIIKGFKSSYSYLKKEWSIESNVDTLKSFLSGFIEWKSGKKKPMQLGSLEIEIEPTGMSADMLSTNKQILIVSNQKKITYKRIVSAYNRSDGIDDLNVEYTSSIDDNMKQSLLELLTQMDLPNMKDSFEVGALHQTEARIKIKTSTGTKNIYDYGLEGSYGLRMLYKQLFTLMKVFKANAARYLTNYDYLLLE